jgi:hypothetical protein
LAISNLTINNDLVCNANIRVANTLKLNGGKMIMGENRLDANLITSYNSTRYVALCDEFGTPAASPWGVRKTITAGSSFTFPIGYDLTNYMPFTISNTSGPNEEFLVNIVTGAIAGANANEAVGLTWNIAETTAGGNTADLKFQWDESDEGSSFNRSNCAILKSDGTNIDYTGYTIQSGAATTEGGTAWSKTVTGVTAFSPWGISSQSNLLPIELLKFEVFILNKNTAQLMWEITPNSTPKAFEILKSEDGKTYKSIGKINAANSLNYTFKDFSLKQGISYFKLIMIDNQDVIEYSKTISVENTGAKDWDIQLSPNLVKDNTYLKFTGEWGSKAHIQIFNIKGTLEKDIPIKTNENKLYLLECQDLPQGLYLVRILTEGGISKSVRLIKQ